MSASYKTIAVHTPETAVALIELHRPEAANALNKQMGKELASALKALGAKNAKARVILITGAGKHFCAGADLKERRGMDKKTWHAQHAAFESALSALLACPIPVIAVVQGAAMGGGLELALACDFILASKTATFALPEVTLGIMPGMGGTQNLPRAIGVRQAKEKIFSGMAFTAEEAYRMGLVNRLCSPDILMYDSLALARTIAQNAPLAIRAVKKSINQGIDQPLHKALLSELAHYEQLLDTRDRREGINAFNEKRKPVFTGR